MKFKKICFCSLKFNCQLSLAVQTSVQPLHTYSVKRKQSLPIRDLSVEATIAWSKSAFFPGGKRTSAMLPSLKACFSDSMTTSGWVMLKLALADGKRGWLTGFGYDEVGYGTGMGKTIPGGGKKTLGGPGFKGADCSFTGSGSGRGARSFCQEGSAWTGRRKSGKKPLPVMVTNLLWLNFMKTIFSSFSNLTCYELILKRQCYMKDQEINSYNVWV